jgi:hypothetical protein
VTLSGENFFTGCDDVGGGTVSGCFQDPIEDPIEKSRPTQNMKVEVSGPITKAVRQQLKTAERPIRFQHTIDLALIDADSQNSFRTVVRLPRVPAGAYFLSVGPVSRRVRIHP